MQPTVRWNPSNGNRWISRFGGGAKGWSRFLPSGSTTKRITWLKRKPPTTGPKSTSSSTRRPGRYRRLSRSEDGVGVKVEVEVDVCQIFESRVIPDPLRQNWKFFIKF